MKKILLWGIILTTIISLIVSFSVMGCKEEAPAEEAAEEATPAEEAAEEAAPAEEAAEEEVPVSLKIIWPTGPFSVKMEEIVEEFQQMYPNVTIELEALEPQFMLDMTRSQIEAEEYFDISFGWGGNANWGPDFYTDKYTYELTPFFEKYGWGDVQVEGAKDLKSPDGKWYLLSHAGAITHNVIYNKGLFKELGIGEPGPIVSWEEFIDIANTLEDNGYIALTLGGANKYNDNNLFCNIVTRVVPADVYKQYLFSSTVKEYKWDVKWTDPEILEAIGYLQEMNDYLANGTLGMEMSEAQSLLTTTNDAGMYLAANWEIPTIREAADEAGVELGYFNFLQIKSDIPPVVAVTNTSVMFVPRYVKEENIETIGVFLDYFIQPEMNLEYTAFIGSSPVVVGTTNDDLTAAGFDPLIIEMINTVSDVGSVEIFDAWMYPELQNASISLAQGIMGKTLVSEEDINSALEKMDEITAEQRK